MSWASVAVAKPSANQSRRIDVIVPDACFSRLASMILKIRQVGEPVLRQKARDLSPDEILDPGVQGLIESMRETMHDAPGVGLAAPQIGVALRLAVIEDQPEFIDKLPPEQVQERERRAVPYHVIINPVLTIDPSEMLDFFEGCLSLGGF